MTTTDSFTHCCTNRPPDGFVRRAWRQALLLCGVLLIGLLLLSTPAHADGDGADVRLEHTGEGVFLHATLDFDLPPLAEDALYKGISMFFVAEAEMVRERWYWSDKTVAQVSRYLRLSYQPLTRRWRLNQSPIPFAGSGIGVVLGQSYDTLEEALSAMQRIVRWKIADGGTVEDDATQIVHFRFRLDMSQLPRPLQIGAFGRSGWSLLMARTVRVPPEGPR